VDKVKALGRPVGKAHIQFHGIPGRKKIRKDRQGRQDDNHKTPHQSWFVPPEFSPYQMPVTFRVDPYLL
jgi:hypothetical protein